MKEICDLCQVQMAMLGIMQKIDGLPEFNGALLDDAISDVYNAADVAYGMFRHLHEGEQEVKPGNND